MAHSRLPEGVLVSIFDKCLKASDAPFAILSGCCKEFYGLLHKKDVLRKLRFDCTPEAVLAVSPQSLKVLKDAMKAGNDVVGCLLGLHLTFNGDDPDSGINYLEDCDKQPQWVSRYIRAIGLLKVGRTQEASHVMQRLLQDMGFERVALLDCRDLLRQMLLPGKHTELGTTNLCILCGPTHWQSKTVAEIEDANEFSITCPFCLIDVETYKLRHNMA